MRYGSLFSGIEAASLAWRPLGWQCAWVAEIDPFCRALLKHHYPDVPNLGDVTKVDWDAVEPVDLIVGGSPCQSFSVAGKRLGLDDPRGNLALVYLDVVRRVRPRWVLYENVPGLLSSDEGRDFGAFLADLGELGYGFAYRILDAQHGGVPQRRRRLWVVGHSGGQWQRAAAVLFDEQSLHGDPPPGRKTWERVAAFSPSSIGGYSVSKGEGGSLRANGGDYGGGTETLIAFGGNNTAGPIEVATACNAHGGPHGRLDFESETFITHALDSYSAGRCTEDGTGRGTPLVPISFTGGASDCISAENLAQPVTGRNGDPGMIAMAFHQNSRNEIRTSAMAAALSSGGGKPGQGYPAIQISSGVRRLTPIECERLMAMPDNYTLVPYRGKPAADGPRYKAIGNSMVVGEIRWLGERIEAITRCLEEKADHPPSPPAT